MAGDQCTKNGQVVYVFERIGGNVRWRNHFAVLAKHRYDALRLLGTGLEFPNVVFGNLAQDMLGKNNCVVAETECHDCFANSVRRDSG